MTNIIKTIVDDAHPSIQDVTFTFTSGNAMEIHRKALAVQALYGLPDENVYVNVVFPNGDFHLGSLMFFPNFQANGLAAKVTISVSIPKE